MLANSLWPQILALSAVLPVGLCGVVGAAATRWFWGLALFAAAVVSLSVGYRMIGGWSTGFSTSLWVIAATVMVLLPAIALVYPASRALAAFAAGYSALLGLLALVWSGASERTLTTGAPEAWVVVHISSAVITFGLVTHAAFAGVAVWLRERALKRRQYVAWIDQLPSVADAEALQFRLLKLAAILLALGVASGMSIAYFERGLVLPFNHKSLLTLIAFAALLAMLAAHQRFGLRGRRAVRLVLIGQLLLTFAYPGVKFVTDVLHAG